MKLRYKILVVFFFLLYSILVIRFYSLQIKQGKDFITRAKSIESVAQNDFKRETIFFTDRSQNLIPAAINKEFPFIFAVPKEVEQPEEAARLLSSVIGLEEKKIAEILAKPGDLYELLAEKVSSKQIEAVKNLNLKGVYINNRNFRYYPFQNLASHLLGFVGLNKENVQPTGLYGLEHYYNQKLQKEDLTLTVDYIIQTRAEEILTDLIKKFDAKSGTVIVQEPQSGAILALANKPDFDPNNYSQSELKLFLNPAIQNFYEPGSVLKVLTMAAGLDSGKITPESVYYDSGSVTFNGKTIKNWDNQAYGKTTMSKIIERSLNTGAVWVERAIGHKLFSEYLKKFGLEEITGVDFPLEQPGDLKNLEEKEAQDINFATASFGMGIAVSPLELVNAFSAIANGGKLMRPYFNAAMEPDFVRQVISPQVARQVTEMMVSAVEKAGVAAIPNYQLAGKTGTAYLPDFKKGGYTDEVINTYIGFGPADNPRFVIFLRIEQPQNAPLAGSSVVPAFKDLAGFILNYYNIPPDKL